MTHINQRRDTAANWIVVDPILQEGEVGWETDTLRAKLGNGVDLWSALDYVIIDPSLYATLASPVFTGDPKVPTVASTDNDTTIASTAFVHSLTDPIEVALDDKAPSDSPSFTGNPTAPTPAAADDDQSIATTEWVNDAIAAGLVGATVVPPGTITAHAGSAAPTGWLLADGSAVSRTTYAALYAECGTTFGAGDGSTTFNLPNLKGRFVVGIDAGGTNPEFDTRGELGGGKTHSHPLSSAGWARIYVNGTNGDVEMDYTTAGAGWTSNRGAASTLTAGGNSNPNGARLEGATDSASNLPPYMALNYIIKI